MNVPIESKDLTVTHLVSECGKMTQSTKEGMIDRQLHSNWGLAKKYELPHADNGTSTRRDQYQRRKYKTPMGLQRPNRQGDTSKKTRHHSHKEGEEMSYHIYFNSCRLMGLEERG